MRKLSGRRPLLRVESEAAEVVETRPFDKIEQFFKAGICLAGKAHNKRRANSTTGEAGPEPLDKPADALFGMGAEHQF